MADFTSALYLGWNHSGQRSSGGRSEALTLGKPAALEEMPGSRVLGQRMAALAGFPMGLAAPSTLHLSLDVCLFLADQGVEFLVERGAYPVMRWGLELAAARGCTVRWFAHHRAESLRLALRSARRPPVVVADGFCPACGSAAPLRAYLAMARECGGRLLIDDSQGIGILGERTGDGGSEMPYGRGGGGTPQFLGLRGEDMIVIHSLAKAFGAPLACVLGSTDFIRSFARQSRTRVHCTAPASTAIRAGLDALDWNQQVGDSIRGRLFHVVVSFRKTLLGRGWTLAGGSFPVQAISSPEAALIHSRLYRFGVRTLLQSSAQGPRVTFVLNARHTADDLRQVAEALDGIRTRISFVDR